MRWVNALSTRPSLEAAVREVVERSQAQLESPADLGLVFISSTFASEYPRLLPLLSEALDLPVLVGCGGGGIVGMESPNRIQEIEGETALSLTLARLPGVKLHAFHLSAEDLPDLDSPPDAWAELVGVDPAEQPNFILMAEPVFSSINDLLQGLDYAYPGAIKVGGLTDGSGMGHGNLFCNGKLYRDGVVGVALSGNLVMETIVAQGCRPIGQPFRVVEGDRNIMIKIAPETAQPGSTPDRTPLEALQELLQDLSDADRELAQHSLFVGIAQSEFKQQLEQGDFLIRNLLGVDPRAGAVAIGDRVRPGQRIQFHLRDADASATDLETLLRRYQAQSGQASAAGALMFSCLGRGEGLYGKPNFDSALFQRYIAHTPVSGFFCNGEIGPVGSTTFLHGYTSVFGICRPRQA
ncbi:FIST N domain protein [Leptolyngbya sp. O-77]|nr:FIST N domain protein [Leptolyngbya sp. O-77]